MPIRRIHVAGAVVIILLLTASAANLPALLLTQHSAPNDWPAFRRDLGHTGDTPAVGAFAQNAGSSMKQLWTYSNPNLEYIFPPTVADLNGDGHPSVIQAGLAASVSNGQISFKSGFDVIDGRTGANRWTYGPNDAKLLLFPPTIGDVNGDGKKDIVFYDFDPLGSSALGVNQLHAYDSSFHKLWDWKDPQWTSTSRSSKVPIMLAPAIGNVDGEDAYPEVVDTALLVTISQNVNGNGGFSFTLSNPEQEVVAINGETGTSSSQPSISWQRFLPHSTLSSPALGDLDGDGHADVVWGSGIKPGTLTTASLQVTLSNDFNDHHIMALQGGFDTDTSLMSYTVGDNEYPGADTAPLLVGLNGDGKQDIVMGLHDVKTDATYTDTTRLVAVDANDSDVNGNQLWSLPLNAFAPGPLAAGDLNGDGHPDIVLQSLNGSQPDFDGPRVLAVSSTGSVLWHSQRFDRNLTSAPAIGDLDGDGVPEIAAIMANTTTLPSQLIVLNGSNGSVKWTYNLGTQPEAALLGPVIADLNGTDNGRPEILVNLASPSGSTLLALQPMLPDLAPVANSMSISPDPPTLYTQETVSATIANNGGANAANAKASLLLDGTPIADQTISVNAGASQSVSFTWTANVGGPHTLTIRADPQDQVAEWDETNNDISKAVSVSAADFAFAAGDPTFNPNPAGSPGTTTVSATLKNIGAKDATSVQVTFYDEGVAFSTTFVASLPANSNHAVSAVDTIPANSIAHRNITVVADPGNAIPENDETNNAATQILPVSISAPDLILNPADMHLSDANPDERSTLHVTATIYNSGSGASLYSDAHSVDVVLYDNGTAVQTQNYALIQNGASQSVDFAYAVGEGPDRVGRHNLTRKNSGFWPA